MNEVKMFYHNLVQMLSLRRFCQIPIMVLINKPLDIQIPRQNQNHFRLCFIHKLFAEGPEIDNSIRARHYEIDKSA